MVSVKIMSNKDTKAFSCPISTIPSSSKTAEKPAKKAAWEPTIIKSHCLCIIPGLKKLYNFHDTTQRPKLNTNLMVSRANSRFSKCISPKLNFFKRFFVVYINSEIPTPIIRLLNLQYLLESCFSRLLQVTKHFKHDLSSLYSCDSIIIMWRNFYHIKGNHSFIA